ncbi:hypothetical protein PINS_up010058 [Pythium insidiosum]|nr:hypothetical protein PINS_up010058 [Pythium insidiosum]
MAAHPAARFVPIRVLFIALFVVAFGVLVLIKTRNLSPTAGIPASVLKSGVGVTITSNNSSAPLNGTADATPPRLRADASNCTVRWFDQKVDHFGWAAAALDGEAGVANDTANASKPLTYKQRYLVNDDHWNAQDPKAPIFFYTGNEGDVTLYANHTGLMWENAASFRALIVFAEHRYYGESLPFGADYMKHLQYLNHEQALADYAELIYFLQREYNAENHPVILFGGSYGGMLAAWFRMKYPSIVHGAIAASAPIFGFPAFPEFKGDNYWSIVTRDASPETGSDAKCIPNVKKSWPKILALAKTQEGRTKLKRGFPSL